MWGRWLRIQRMHNAGTRLPGTPEPMASWPGRDGLPLAGDVWGPAQGRLVLLLHGGGQTRHAWKGTGERLGALGYRVVAYDARGHGDSGWDAGQRYHIEHMADDLCCLARALSDQPPVLVGASMGGLTSMIALGEKMLQAAALVLVDIAPRIDEDGRRGILDFMGDRPDGFDSLDEVADAIARFQPHRPRPRRLDGLGKNLRLGGDGRYRWHWDPNLTPYMQSDPELNRRLEAGAARLDNPTLLVRGALSDILSDESARHFLELCPHSEFINVADAAHMVAGDRNDVFGDAMIEFVSRVAPAQR